MLNRVTVLQMFPLFALALFCITLVSVEAFYGHSNIEVKSHQIGKFKAQALKAEIRILISGTKNAYTTVRSGDVVYYAYEVGDKVRAFGLFTAEGTVAPLCNYLDESKDVLYLDKEQEPMSVKHLVNENKLLRIVSSDKRGERYVIEEYIDDDVYIPVRDPSVVPYQASDDWGSQYTPPLATQEETPVLDISSTEPPKATSHTGASSSSTLEKKIELVKLQLEVASLKVKLIELEMTRERSSVQFPVVVSSKLAPLPVQGAPYSQAVKSNGLLFVSGCLGIDPLLNKLVTGGIEAQTKRALTNLDVILRAGDSSAMKVLKVTILLSSMDDYVSVNKLYAEFFKARTPASTSYYPARTTYQVAKLPLDALVEIDAIATSL
jgi:2-iminobutanoate/2-iminopropanoate deaminase